MTLRLVPPALALALLAASAAGAEPLARTAAKPPSWKLKERVVSSYRCTTSAGETNCGVRSSATLKVTTSIPFAGSASAPNFAADAAFTLSIGRSSWTLPLSADAAYAPGARRATLVLLKDSGTLEPTLTASLRWTATGVKVTVTGRVTVVAEDFVDNPSEGAGKVDRPLRTCVRLGDVRADFGVRVKGRQSATKHVTPDPDGGGETELMPQASLSGKGAADGRTAPPAIAAEFVRAATDGPPERSPDVTVSGVAVSGGSVARITSQLDAGPEVDVSPQAVLAFPCGGEEAIFSAIVHFREGGRHTVTVRAYDAQSRAASASATYRYDGPTAFPRIVRIMRLGTTVRGAPGDWSVMGMIDDAGRLWVQGAAAEGKGEDTSVRLQPSARPTGLVRVKDVTDYVVDVHGSGDTVDRVRWIAVHDDGSVEAGGKTVAGLPPVETLAWYSGYGYRSGLALTQDRRVFWGDNGFGELGDGPGATREQPAEIAGLSGAVRIHATNTGERFALTSGGALFAWGNNANLHRGDVNADPTVPGLVPASSPVADFVLDSRGERLLLAHTDGTVTGLSSTSAFHHLGNGRAVETSAGAFFAPRNVLSLAGIGRVIRDDVTFADGTCFAIRASDGALFAWGANGDGSTGLVATTSVLTPALVPGISLGVTSVRLWADGVVALAAGGGVWGWGRYDSRRIHQTNAGGVGTASRTPVQVPGLPQAVQVEMVFNHAYCLTTDGRVFFWTTYGAAYEPREILFYE